MEPEIRAALADLLRGQHLTAEAVTAAIGTLMDGRASPVATAALLTALSCCGETEVELAGAARAMRSRSARIHSRRQGLLDTCGTGGDALSTFNISTATAIVVAAVGVPVAKHGNRKASSASGSADVLEALGVNIELNAQQAGACLDEIGLAFCYARQLHEAMRHVAPVRTELGFRTIFNLLGPLTNPAGAEYQLIGANSIATAEKLAGAAAQLGIRKAFVVCGNAELDEVALWGPTTVFVVEPGTVTETEWHPDDFGLPPCRVADLQVESAAASADCIRRILANDDSPARSIVLANAAAALLCCDRVSSLREGVELAAAALSSGAGARKLQELVETSHRLMQNSS